jgi:zinc transport system permease protein
LALGLCALLGIPNDKDIFVTFPVCIAAAILLMWLSRNGKLKGDAATAIVSTGTVADGYILFEFAEAGSGDVCSGLFGASVLTLQMSDMIESMIFAGAVLLVYILLYRKIFAVTFDEDFARASGVNTNFYNMVLSLLTAVTVVVGMKLIG